MIKRLMCYILGHKWDRITHNKRLSYYVKDGKRFFPTDQFYFKCQRCGKVK